MQKMSKWCGALVLAATFLCMVALSPRTAMATPVEVAYTVTGSTGNWALDFSFTNNLSPAPADMSLYFLGVSIDAGATSARDIVGSPAGYNPNSYTTWTNAFNGGSSTTYNNIWYNSSINSLFPGTTLSGFLIHVTDLTAPISVLWFAYGAALSGGAYTGGEQFTGSITNPGFEGVAQGPVSAVPEPSTLLLLGSGLVGLAAWRRKHAA